MQYYLDRPNREIPHAQKEFIMQYYLDRPNREIPHAEVVPWATRAWEKEKGRILKDPDRQIRSLHDDGILVKIRKGVYLYDPDQVEEKESEDFTPAQKKATLEAGDYKCVMCGKGKEHGVELHVDRVKPKRLGGKATLINGQVLCSKHNFYKKTYSQTESGKYMFLKFLEIAKDEEDTKMVDFCLSVLEVYELHDINGHIKW